MTDVCFYFQVHQPYRLAHLRATGWEEAGGLATREVFSHPATALATAAASTGLVNVDFFHTTHRGWKDRLTKLTKGSRKNLISHLEKQNPTGGTNIYDPLEAALTDDHVDTILLLSDGVPGSGKYVATEDILRGVRRLNQTRRIAIHCVSLGMDSALLKRLAAENGGRYVRR